MEWIDEYTTIPMNISTALLNLKNPNGPLYSRMMSLFTYVHEVLT